MGTKPYRKIQFGTGRSRVFLGGIHTSSITPVGNITTGVDDLITATLEANALYKNGAGIRITAFGVTAANTNNKEVILVFGGTTILTTGVLAANNKPWWLTAIIQRQAVAVQQSIAWGMANNLIVVPAFTALTKDETSALIIKCTGEATSTDDIIQEGLIIEGLGV